MSDVKTYLRRVEATRLRVYDDATGAEIRPGSMVVGHPTIGTGRALDVRGLRASEENFLLDNDVDEAEAALAQTFDTWHSLSPARQAVLIGMHINLGAAGFAKFQRMIDAVKTGAWDQAAAQAKASLRYSQIGERGPLEVAMLQSGEWV